MARNKELNDQMREARMETIHSAALKLFTQKGLGATKISDIAKEAGMSHGLMYHYYKSKEEIFTELVKIAFERLIGASESLMKMPIPPEEKIKLAFEKILEGMTTSGNHSRFHYLVTLAFTEENSSDELKEFLENNYRKPYEIIAEIMTAGQNSGTIKDGDPDELALLFWSVINGLAIYKTNHQENFDPPEVDLILRMFIK
ncbi:MAG: TetR family transcriptional regulator [Melioribacteraceae bacterium]|nr:MAG: TetR family transcriptional regulator [Melioribacteraceae bacterium]